MSSHGHHLESELPDVREIPLEVLRTLDGPEGSALANSIATFVRRMQDNAEPLSSFNAKI